MGQVLPNGTYRSDPLGPIGIESSVGSIVLVPSGYPGAGNIIIASYSASIIYRVPYTIEVTGFYTFLMQTAEEDIGDLADGPEGIAYIPAGSQGFPNLSMVISSYGANRVVVYEVGEEGLPIVATGKEMVTGLTGAEGALIDPLTGDFLFSTFGGGDKVIRISGFEKPSGIGDHNDNINGNNSFRLAQNQDRPEITILFDQKARLVNSFMTIYSMNGQPLICRQLIESNTTIDISSLSAGMYIVKVSDDNGIQTAKFIR